MRSKKIGKEKISPIKLTRKIQDNNKSENLPEQTINISEHVLLQRLPDNDSLDKGPEDDFYGEALSVEFV